MKQLSTTVPSKAEKLIDLGKLNIDTMLSWPAQNQAILKILHGPQRDGVKRYKSRPSGKREDSVVVVPGL